MNDSIYRLASISEVEDFISQLKSGELKISKNKAINNHMLIDLTDGDRVILTKELGHYWPQIQLATPTIYDPLIYGKDSTEKIVSIEAGDSELYIYRELTPGTITVEVRPFKRWIIGTDRPRGKYSELEGNLPFKYIQEYENKGSYLKNKGKCFSQKEEFYSPNDDREHALLMDGYTYFKGMKISDVSVLSFDIETSGLEADSDDAMVFLISNVYRAGDKVEVKLFDIIEEGSEQKLIESWISWVNEKNPSVICGHNIVSFDLVYLNTRAQMNGLLGLEIGRDGSSIRFNTKPSQIRVDGNTSYDYYKAFIHGREIVDTWALAIKYDVGRKFPSYGLKPIIGYLGYEKEGRIKWDFETKKPIDIYLNINNRLNEWEEFREYCRDDAFDSIKLYDLMIPSFFYLTSYIPKTFQTMIETNSGGWINHFLLRGYLQELHSIPKVDEMESIAGGISHGIPGIYSNVLKFDAKSYYPSTILAFNIYPKHKDPKKYFYKMVEYFTHRRFDQKKLFKQTGDKYYDDLQSSSKIFINSAYGSLATTGLNFNSREDAKKITQCCRKGLQKAVYWATGKDLLEWFPDYINLKGYQEDFSDYSYIDSLAKISFSDMKKQDYVLCNIDTDALSFCKNDGSKFSDDEKKEIYEYLNKIMYCEWEPDGEYDVFTVSKAKNYFSKDSEGNIVVHGGSFKDSKKEKALQEMVNKFIMAILENKKEILPDIYSSYILEVNSNPDMTRWATKRTITKSVLNPQRTNEQKLYDAIQGLGLKEGDKVWVYFDSEDNLRVVNSTNGNENPVQLMKRVWSTVKIFENILDMSQFPKYHLKNKKIRAELATLIDSNKYI